ncbi:hypothetical protein [Methanogenium cariaci]|uniref:hypothetical protein n=1 Tax=Methanogenium cariaci TaxID=2197 RepID=UPI00155DBE2B|nr:hypothetical protein [Methanogenium cariaci]
MNSRAHKPVPFYACLKGGDIPSMRKQGGNLRRRIRPPSQNITVISATMPFPLTMLRQCTLCGRWACSSCWTQEFYVCNSCHGTYKLHIQPLLQSGSVEHKE